ncbi:MAG TPA: EamA family transporter [Anaerolineae bacterium]|nr:EamA family transporter [Anaerolineae bacterium]
MQPPAPQPTNLTRGYMAALISAGFLSTTAIFIRYLTQSYQMPALVLACWRDFFVALSLLPILGFFRPRLLQVDRKHLAYLLAYGFLLAVFNSLWTLSVTLNGAAVSTVLAYCSAGFTALLGWWFLKERLDWGKLLAVTLSLAGCVLVSGALDPAAWTANVLGIITGIFSGLAYAIYTLMGRKASQDGLNPWSTLIYTFFFAAIFLLIANLSMGSLLPGAAATPSDMLWLGNRTAGWIILFLLAAGPTLAGFGLYNVSLVDLPSSVANLVVTLEPVFTAVIAYILLHERLNPTQIVGGLLILGGVIFLRIYEGRVSARVLESTV